MHTNIKFKSKANNIDAHIGNNIKKIRKINSLTQEEAAQKLGISFQQFQKYENGKNRISSSSLYTLSKELNVDITDFFVGLDNEINFDQHDKKMIQIFREIENEELKKEVIKLLKNFIKKHD